MKLIPLMDWAALQADMIIQLQLKLKSDTLSPEGRKNAIGLLKQLGVEYRNE